MNTGLSVTADSPPYLVIDDHAMRAALFVRLLARERSRETFVVANASGARDLAEAGRAFAIVLLVLGGLRVTETKAVADHISDVVSLGWPLAIVADDGNASDAQHVLALGATGYVTTDLTEPVFVAALNVVMAGGSFVSPHCMLGLADNSSQHAGSKGVHHNGTFADGAVPSSMRDLSPRQLDVLRLVSFGRLNKEIAHNLNMTEGTVKAHVRGILRKLSVANRTQAAHLYMQANHAQSGAEILESPRGGNGDGEIRRILC